MKKNRTNPALALKQDRKISLYVAFYFIAFTCNMAIKNIFPIPLSMWGMLSVLWGMGILTFMLMGLPEVLRRSSKLLFQTYILFIALFLLSVFMATFRGEPTNAILRDDAFVTLAWWIPLGVYSCSVYDKRILYDTLYKGSFVIATVLLLYFYFGKIVVINEDENDYSMTFGIAFIMPILLHLNELFKKRRNWLLALVSIEIITVVIFANRTVLLSLIFFLVYKWTVGNKSSSRRMLVIFAACAGIMLYTLFFESFLFSTNSLLDSYNLQSRTLTMMANDNINDDSGRGEIWAICANMILERPLFGWGIGGEFYTISKEFNGITTNVSGASSTHNGILQALVNFGIIGGIIVVIIYIIPLFRISRVKDSSTHDLILITGSVGLIPCLISASGLFIKPELAIYIYLYYNYVKKKTVQRSALTHNPL